MEVLRPDVEPGAWWDLASPCRLCEVRCGVDRRRGERGLCGVGERARYYNAFVHHGEEPGLVPSFTLFVTGCNFRCTYCSDGEWVDHPERGRILDPEAMAARILALRGSIRTVELVGGLPDVNLPALSELVRLLPPDLPVVLNTNGWLTMEAVDLLPPMVDLMLLDVKHGAEACARSVAKVPPGPGYLEHLGRVLERAAATLRYGVWVRHLLLPGHLDCCTRPALTWLATRFPGTVVNVMTQYQPLHHASGELGRTLRADEVEPLVPWLRTLDLEIRLDGRPL